MAGVSSKTVSERIKDILTEGLSVFQSLGPAAAKTAYEYLTNEIQTAATGKAKTACTIFDMLNTALSYLFDPEEGYVPLKNQLVALLGNFGEPLKEDDIPSTVKPHLDQLKRNLTEAEKHLGKVEKGITELFEFIKSNLGRRMTKKKLERINFTKEEINVDLRVCKTRVTEAQTAMEEAKKATHAILLYYGVGAAGVALGGVIACGIGAIGTAVACQAVAPLIGVGGVAGVAGVGGVAVAGVSGVAGMIGTAAFTVTKCREYMGKFCSYAKLLDDFNNGELSKLKTLNQKIKVNGEQIAFLKEEMEVTRGCCPFNLCRRSSNVKVSAGFGHGRGY